MRHIEHRLSTKTTTIHRLLCNEHKNNLFDNNGAFYFDAVATGWHRNNSFFLRMSEICSIFAPQFNATTMVNRCDIQGMFRDCVCRPCSELVSQVVFADCVCGISTSVVHQLPKLRRRVRLPYAAQSKFVAPQFVAIRDTLGGVSQQCISICQWKVGSAKGSGLVRGQKEC